MHMIDFPRKVHMKFQRGLDLNQIIGPTSTGTLEGSDAIGAKCVPFRFQHKFRSLDRATSSGLALFSPDRNTIARVRQTQAN